MLLEVKKVVTHRADNVQYVVSRGGLRLGQKRSVS